MDVGTVFLNNKTQAVRLPVDSRFPEAELLHGVEKSGEEKLLPRFELKNC